MCACVLMYKCVWKGLVSRRLAAERGLKVLSQTDSQGITWWSLVSVSHSKTQALHLWACVRSNQPPLPSIYPLMTVAIHSLHLMLTTDVPLTQATSRGEQEDKGDLGTFTSVSRPQIQPCLFYK